jgi:hypothetical protein
MLDRRRGSEERFSCVRPAALRPEFLDRFMAVARSPNKTLEPTTMAVTPRATPVFYSDARLAAARGVPAMVVAHL